MFRDYTLAPSVWHEKPLQFSWNAATGELRGRDADRVRALVDAAVRDGEVSGHPVPTTYRVSNPLRVPAEMAAVLARFWILTDDLLAAIPDHDDDDLIVEIDDDGTEHPLPYRPVE